MDKKQQTLLSVGRTGFSGFIKSKNQPAQIQSLKDDEEPLKHRRPKTYRETLSVQSQHPSESGNQSSSSDSEDSDDSYTDFMDDILKNDITLRTKMPMLPKLFRNTTKSTASISGKTTDSVKRGKSIISIQDFSHLIPDKRELAMEYILFGDSPEFVAKFNATVAEKYGYEEIAQCWRMIANVLVGRTAGNFYNYGWDQHILGGKLFIKKLIEYFEKCQNIQMLAMLSCIFVTLGRPAESNCRSKTPTAISENTITFYNNEFGTSPYHQSTPASFFSGETPIQNVRLKFGNNQGPFNDGSSIISEDYFHQNHNNKNAKYQSNINPAGYAEPEFTVPDIKIKILHDDVLDLALLGNEPSLVEPYSEIKFRQYRIQYAEMLYIWGLPMDRVELLKFNVNLNTDSDYLKSIEQDAGLDNYKGVTNKWIESNQQLLHNCSYCGLKVDRLVFVCGNCQHVTHRTCAETWWKDGDECPSGCGCSCIEYFDITG